MIDPYTTDPGDLPGLTLETLLETLKALEASLPELLYRTHDWAPRVNSKGEPAMMALPECEAGGGLVPTPTGRSIVILHPDNLPYLQHAVRGKFRLVEWKP